MALPSLRHAVPLLLPYLGRVWPQQAARLAADAFLRTPARATESRAGIGAALEGPGKADAFEAPFGAGRLSGFRIGSGPAVLFVHGWGGSSRQALPFVPALRAAGMSVIAFDAPGHAGSTGTWLAIPEYAAAIRSVVAHVGPIHAVLAHSFGCAATAFAIDRGLSLESVVFVAPPADAYSYFLRFTRALRLPEALAERARAEVERRVGLGFEALDGGRLMPSIAAPLLVIHDEGDREVPASDGARVVSLAPHARLHPTRGLGHRRVLRDAEVIATAVRFLVRSSSSAEARRSGAQPE